MSKEQLEKIEIRSLWTGEAIYTCDLPAEVAGKSYDVQLGFAAKKAHSEGADLRGAYLRDANLRDADLSDANLRDANLSGADLRACPVKIHDIHKAVYAAASSPGALRMESWHSPCGTAHCRAGWVVTLAGDGGAALEYAYGTPAAAAMIYMASDPTLERVPDFYCSNEEALADMARLAGVQS